MGDYTYRYIYIRIGESPLEGYGSEEAGFPDVDFGFCELEPILHHRRLSELLKLLGLLGTHTHHTSHVTHDIWASNFHATH